MIEALREFSLKELLFESTIIAFIFRFVWGIFSEISNRIRQIFAKRVRVYEIDIGLYPSEFDKVVDFFVFSFGMVQIAIYQVLQVNEINLMVDYKTRFSQLLLHKLKMEKLDLFLGCLSIKG